MSNNDGLGPKLERICGEMERFEASKSVEKTGTGSRREGAAFETLVRQMWEEFSDVLIKNGSKDGTAPKGYVLHHYQGRGLLLPSTYGGRFTSTARMGHGWNWHIFEVEDLVEKFPGTSEAADRYAPTSGPYAGDKYPAIFTGLSTKFDDSIVLIDKGVLREKILLEYKTGKSSKGKAIDGNAHERLSFQMMQYLEVATLYTRCSFAVFANGAFARYRNKYHVNFHIQAERLSNFAWFSMEYMCTKSKYERFLLGLQKWLIEGKDRRA